ncbi:MAG: DUF1624 domain-containing protein [Candidatus Diapherotrites archaeon]|uniref:DUF1624 domain-containing protein n=1 Tax=Candidatus Iainarchaeum sp. TaxID=3101447 RepID=A0A8T4L7M4_9ARCH|nr:DUF1624 domain-containing protein [Candidatus Diapherotrites archaeon]
MSASPRIEEVDALRGVGILAVVLFHFFFDLSFLGLSALEPYAGPYLVLQRFAASTMVVVAGISLALSRASARRKGVPFPAKAFRRFLSLAFVALLITVVTWVYPHNGYIVFGIIHFLALSTLLALPLARSTWPALAAAIAFFVAAPYVNNLSTSTPWLLPLGVPPTWFYSLDYFPLVPWFGLFLFGVFFGNHYYARGRRLLAVFPRFPRGLQWLGRHTLWIYLVHQPLLIGFLLAFKSVAG